MIINGFGGNNINSSLEDLGTLVSTTNINITQNQTISASSSYPQTTPKSMIVYSNTSFTQSLAAAFVKYNIIICTFYVVSITAPTITISAKSSTTSGSYPRTTIWPFRIGTGPYYGNNSANYMAEYYRDCTAGFTHNGNFSTYNATITPSQWGALQTNTTTYPQKTFAIYNKVGMGTASDGGLAYAYTAQEIASSYSTTVNLTQLPQFKRELYMTCYVHAAFKDEDFPKSNLSFTLSGASATIACAIYGKN